MSDGMGREFAYLSSHANNRYFIPNWGNKSISKSRFSKVLLNFADELLIASLQISVYWLSGSDVMLL